MAKRRNYLPINPHKYNGEYPIVLKSNWEEAFAREICDLNVDCVEWAYEPWKIPYDDPTTFDDNGKPRHTIYVPDFLVTVHDGEGRFVTTLVEIKPKHEAVLSEVRDEKDAITFMRNQAKWEAAEFWCQRRANVNFQILTEDQLGSLAGGYAPPPKKKAKRRVKKS